MTLLSCGDCPVCSDAGGLVALRSKLDGSIIYWCPFCETAWPTHPRGRVDSIQALVELAPGGVDVLTNVELFALAADEGFSCREHMLDWTREIEDLSLPESRRRAPVFHSPSKKGKVVLQVVFLVAGASTAAFAIYARHACVSPLCFLLGLGAIWLGVGTRNARSRDTVPR